MLNILKLGAPDSDAANYCQSECQDDAEEASLANYYASDNAQKVKAGIWRGRGAEALGIQDLPVSDDAFAALLRGRAPSGEPLVQNPGNGRVAGWDAAFAAPKSVSVAWACAEQQVKSKIEQAREKAVATAMDFLEKNYAWTRRGHGSTEHEQIAGFVRAEYAHCINREVEPHLHTHVICMNIGVREDGSAGTIESHYLMKARMAAGAVYRAVLAREINEIGFKTERDRQFFKISDMPKALCEHFSKAKERIDADMNERGVSGHRESHKSNARTKPAKTQFSAAIDQQWRGEAAGFGIDATAMEYLARGEMPENVRFEPPEERDGRTIFEKLTQSESVFSIEKIWQLVAIEAAHAGGKSLEEMQARVQELVAPGGEIVKLSRGGRIKYSTRAMVRLENDMRAHAESLAEKSGHKISVSAVAKAQTEVETGKGFEFSEEQQAALIEVTTAADLALVNGVAGAGKSTIFEAARIAWEQSGYRVRGAVLSAVLASEFEAGSGIKAQTVHSLIADLEQNRLKLDSRTVLVVDEAGMVGSVQMRKLLDHAKSAGTKVVLCGDTKQLQAIDAGAAFRALVDIFGAARLHTSRRREADEDTAEALADAEADTEAAAKIRAGDVLDALMDFHERGVLTVHKKPDDARRQLVEEWWEEAGEMEDKIMLVATRADAFDLNQRARHKMIEAGRLGPLPCTVETPNGLREFREGDRVAFKRNNHKLDVRNGERGTLISAKPVVRGSGWIMTVQLKDRVVAFRTDQLNEIDHGYATTVHSAQGATASKVFCLVGGSMQDRETTYVQVTRHKHGLRLFAAETVLENLKLEADEDREAAAVGTLAKVVEKSHQKETTLDYKLHDELAPE